MATQHVSRLFVRLAVALAAAALLAASCAPGTGSDGKTRMGLKRIELELAFEGDADGESDDGESDPSDAVVAVEAPAVAEFAATVDPSRFTSAPVAPFEMPEPEEESECVPAPPGTPASDAATVTIRKPPAAGDYPVRRAGEFDLTVGTFAFKGPMAPFGMKQYVDTRLEEPPPSATGNPTPPNVHYTVREEVGESYVVKEFRATPSWLELMRMEIKVGDDVRVFEPTPPVRYMNMGTGAAALFRHAGSDPETGTGLVVEGQIERQEAVDVCGEVVDAWRVRLTERMTSLGADGSAPFTYMTTDAFDADDDGDGQPNYLWVATHRGGLFIKEEFHTIYQSGATSLQLDYTNTFMSATPT